MLGEIIEIFIVMLIVAGIAFAPLGYFIHCYMKKNGKPFGDFENRTPHKKDITQ